MKLYTIGYGNRTPNGLIAVLKKSEIKSVVDVRKENCKAWLRSYWKRGGRMSELIEGAGIDYVDGCSFGNEFDTLEEYKGWLASEGRVWLEALANAISGDSFLIWRQPVCLLCAELRPDSSHRKVMAEALMPLLGSDWEIKHI